jgi:two-component system, cell cycle response regulator
MDGSGDARTPAAADQHATEVGELAARVSRELGLDEALVWRVELAGRLHDVGEALISRAVLDKPGALAPHEWDEVRRHPEHGAALLESTAFDDIRPWVLLHHERPDGRGYPFGLAGAEIPLEASIVAVAEGWSAMTADRPYRRALRPQDAVEELRRGAGRQWHTGAVVALLGVVERGFELLRPLGPGAALRLPPGAARAPRGA